ncbi:MAG: hypothetical protein RLZZ511_3891 [Cyanobacteriota bacterium]
MDTNQLRQLTGTADLDQPLITPAEFSVESNQSARPIWMKPLPKFAMVMILLLPIVALAGTFLHGGGHAEPGKTALGQPTQNPSSPSSKPDTATAEMEQEIARLKAKSALDGQAKIEKQLAKQPNSKPIKAVQKPTAKPSATAPTVAKSQPTSTVAIRSEPPKIATAPIPRSSVVRPEVIPVRESSLISRNASIVRSSAIDRTPKVEEAIDPQEHWQQLVRVGSYGAVQPEKIQELEFSNDQPTPNPLQATMTTWEQPNPNIVPTIEAATELAPAKLMAGSNAVGTLETPVLLDDSKSSEQFTISLAEAIPDSIGRTALPANAKLLIRVEGVSKTGRVQLSATAATWEQDGQTKEMTIPSGAIQIRGNQGQPLIAEQFEDKGKELAALDAGQFALSAIRGASSQLIQPNTRVQTGNGSTVITQENQSPNVLAGALQGGADSLLTTISERNKRAAEEIRQRPPIRYLAAGTTVQVFVNQSIQLPL